MKIFNKMNCLALLLAFFMSTAAMASILSPLTDSVNSGIINTKIVTNDGLKEAEVNATVENGIAIFSGEVETQAQFDALIRIAHSVSGIKGVDVSRLKVAHH